MLSTFWNISPLLAQKTVQRPQGRSALRYGRLSRSCEKAKSETGLFSGLSHRWCDVISSIMHVGPV